MLRSIFREVIIFSLLAIFIVLPIRLFVAQPFVVEGASMDPTFKNGDYIIVDELSYRFEAPKRGDVVTFRYPGDPSLFFIKRIIGLPGETVSIQAETITITKTDGEKIILDESYIEDGTMPRAYLSHTLLEDEYFVMGDNRAKSSDSRYWGSLPRENIMGRAFIRLLPANNMTFWPGSSTLPQ